MLAIRAVCASAKTTEEETIHTITSVKHQHAAINRQVHGLVQMKIKSKYNRPWLARPGILEDVGSPAAAGSMAASRMD